MKKIAYFSLAFVLLVLPVLGCGLFTQEAEQQVPTAAATADSSLEESGAEPVEEANNEENGEAPVNDLPALGSLTERLEQYNSYRIAIEMHIEAADDAAESGIVKMETKRIVNPPATSVEMQLTGSFAEDMGESIETTLLGFTEVDGTVYTQFPGVGCIAGSSDAASAEQFTAFLDTEEILGELKDAEFVGEDSLNGQEVYHYRFDENDVPNAEQDIHELEGSVYVSKEENYVVRLVIEGTGDVGSFGGESGGEGTIRMEYNVLDVGATFTIEPPEDCEEAGSAYPVFEGATDVSSFAGLTTYTVEASLEEIVEFYQAEMAALGYELAEAPVLLEEMALLSFNAPDQAPVSVTISTVDGAISVLISADESAE